MNARTPQLSRIAKYGLSRLVADMDCWRNHRAGIGQDLPLVGFEPAGKAG